MWDENIYGTAPGTVGPQFDGTYGQPPASTPVNPVDAGGGLPGSYGQSILDVFKFGVGVWQARDARQDLLDYRRFEATQAGVVQQGQAATQYAIAQQSNTSTLLLLGGAALLLVLLMRER